MSLEHADVIVTERFDDLTDDGGLAGAGAARNADDDGSLREGHALLSPAAAAAGRGQRERDQFRRLCGLTV